MTEANDSSEHDFVDELVQILSSSKAQAKINPDRIVRSTLYDPDYHKAIIACAMRSHGEGFRHRVFAPWLKLLQFVAARPSLVDKFIEYAEKRRDPNPELWSQMPRGYLGDETHDAVVDLLVQSRILQKAGDSIEASSRYWVLEQLAARIETENLFAGERSILDRLRAVKVTKVLLGAS